MQFPLARYLLICIMRQQFVLHICNNLKSLSIFISCFFLRKLFVSVYHSWIFHECQNAIVYCWRVKQEPQSINAWYLSSFLLKPKPCIIFSSPKKCINVNVNVKHRKNCETALSKVWIVDNGCWGCWAARAAKKVEQTNKQTEQTHRKM